jgi:predicted kinase
MGRAIAVFSLGGAAVGKSATIQQLYIGTAHLRPEQRKDAPLKRPRPGFSPRRHYDPDQYKHEIGPMYSDAADASGLYGPSGPRDRAEFELYPPAAQAAAREFIVSLGFASVQDFADNAIPPPKDAEFGGGLTHEASSFIAAANLEGQIAAGLGAGSFVWDAVGNEARYKRWIDASLDAGFEVHLLYVECPLAVALRRASRRARKVTPDIVRSTHLKAKTAFRGLVSWVERHPLGERIHLLTVNTSDDAELAQAVAERFDDR